MKKRTYTRAQLEALKKAGAFKEVAPGLPGGPSVSEPETPPMPEPAPPAPVVVEQSPVRPVRLKVNRDRDGFIESVDVLPLGH